MYVCMHVCMYVYKREKDADTDADRDKLIHLQSPITCMHSYFKHTHKHAHTQRPLLCAARSPESKVVEAKLRRSKHGATKHDRKPSCQTRHGVRLTSLTLLRSLKQSSVQTQWPMVLQNFCPHPPCACTDGIGLRLPRAGCMPCMLNHVHEQKAWL